MVKELEVAIERLQALYNQYFMGIEKLEPLIPKKTVERKLNELRKTKFYNTALRFRFQSQVQKYSTHMTHWRRICRQIEEGTYKRDIMRAKARSDQQERVRDVQTESGAADTGAQEDTGLPVFDLEQMFNEVEDAFEQGFDLDAQLDAITAAPPPKPMPSIPTAQRDVVEPVGGAVQSASTSRTSGVPIPVSSLTASRKTDEARSRAALSSSEGASRFRPASPPQSSATGAAKPPPPQKAAAVPPPPPSPGAPLRKPPPLPSSARPAAAAGTGTSVIDDKKIQSVYRAYMSARKKTNESTDNINLQKISSLLKKTEKEKGGVSDFKVVIRNGKAVIKAVK